MKKRMKLTKKQKNIILFAATFLVIFSLAIYLIFKNYSGLNSDNSPTPISETTQAADSPTPGNETNLPTSTESTATATETPDPSPTATEVIINPGTDAPIYIGVSSKIEVEALNIDLIATLIKERLLEKDFLRVDSGSLDNETSKIEAFETNWKDNYVQVRIRTDATTNLVDDLYKEFLTIAYDNGARKYSLPAGSTPTVEPTPTPGNEKYAYLTINIYAIDA